MGPNWKGSGGVVPQTVSKFLSLKNLRKSIKTEALAQVVLQIEFCEFLRGVPPNYVEVFVSQISIATYTKNIYTVCIELTP